MLLIGLSREERKERWLRSWRRMGSVTGAIGCSLLAMAAALWTPHPESMGFSLSYGRE